MLLDDLKVEAEEVVRTYMEWYTSPLKKLKDRETDTAHMRACLFYDVQSRFETGNPVRLELLIDNLTNTIYQRIEQKLKRNL